MVHSALSWIWSNLVSAEAVRFLLNKATNLPVRSSLSTGVKNFFRVSAWLSWFLSRFWALYNFFEEYGSNESKMLGPNTNSVPARYVSRTWRGTADHRSHLNKDHWSVDSKLCRHRRVRQEIRRPWSTPDAFLKANGMMDLIQLTPSSEFKAWHVPVWAGVVPELVLEFWMDTRCVVQWLIFFTFQNGCSTCMLPLSFVIVCYHVKNCDIVYIVRWKVSTQAQGPIPTRWCRTVDGPRARAICWRKRFLVLPSLVADKWGSCLYSLWNKESHIGRAAHSTRGGLRLRNWQVFQSKACV